MFRGLAIVGLLSLALVPAAQPQGGVTQAQIEAAQKAFIADKLPLIYARPCAFDQAAINKLAEEWAPMVGGPSYMSTPEAQRDPIIRRLLAEQQVKCFEAKQADPATRKTVGEIEALYHVLRTSDCATVQLREVIPKLPQVMITLHPDVYVGMYRFKDLQPDNPQDQCVSRIMGRAILAKSLNDLLR